MIKLRTLLLAAAIAFPAAPALAADGAGPAAASAMTDAQRIAYREILAALRAGDWLGAATRLDTVPDGPLHNALRAELYLAKGSPKVEIEPLVALVNRAPDLPKADQLARLAATRGATELPPLPQPQKMLWQGSQPRRGRADGAPRDAAATLVDSLIQPLIVDNRPSDAEAAFAPHQEELTAEAQAEFRQRIAWSYYIVGDDAAAYRLAEQARPGRGDWAVQAAWVSGLAAWRMKRCGEAADAFADVAARTSDDELAAAGHYWAARADLMCGKPERVQGRLRAAAASKETFYGLLAASALGIRTANFEGLHNYRDAEWRPIAGKPNVRAAIAFAELGEIDLADQFIRHQARIGGAADHDALLHLAADLSLPGTQFWLAHNAPAGARVNIAARYPRPDWQPSRGWRVDQSLVFAHALQESSFRTAVVSPAGATGLLQVRPGTAGDIARARGEAFSPALLTNPASNMEFGQTFIEGLRDSYATGGLLPKVIAAYNAGPVPVAEWNNRRFDRGDPLLYIESIPYWETRGYVPIVLRNYWIYEQESGKSAGSRDALVQGLWPRFPGLPGARAIRVEAADPPTLAYGTK
ncbi:MAG: lytic transglycosylase domain-containing protein [Alphaproteobacteria bacterium]|nr:lytic transglycosylase domain-containing protein [Alphaproteobacteria bacterium]MBV9370608.1 lytic transglycosylase domain-containing protein [Alphaproteobacteria bacterium]MBV9900162.1 lytic transglycosylase domain-containing protein [Alphaproteobacteria bacterium]